MVAATRRSSADTLPGGLPFKNERELRTVVRRCHNRLLFQHGHDQAKAFDELLKVLVAKMHGERRGSAPSLRLSTVCRESDKSIARRIRELFRDACSNGFADVFSVADLEVDDDTLAYIMRELQPYSITSTLLDPRGMDLCGAVFESMVGSTFRGNLGAYFTPRNIVQFMVQVVDPEPTDTVIDPACGSGGFLVGVLRHIRGKMGRLQRGCQDCAAPAIVGVDINERMVRVAKMNLVMHGCREATVVRANGLCTTTSQLSALMNEPRVLQGFDHCLANPPFAGFESDPEVLRQFETGTGPSGKVRSVNKVIPFVEKIISLLREGGRAGLVLPVSVLNAEAEAFVTLRQILFRDTVLLAIVGLPQTAFHHTDCGSHGVLLFLEKTANVPSDYNVFIDWAQDVGYDTVGRPTSRNDLPDILRRYRAQEKSNLFRASDLQASGRLDPEWWHPNNRRLRRSLESSHRRLVRLSSFFDIRRDGRPRTANPAQLVKYFEVNDTDPVTGQVKHIRQAELASLPGRVRLRVEPGDVLLPNHRDSLKAGRSAVIVPEEAAGCLTTNRFIVLRPRVDPIFLQALLNSAYVRQQLLMRARGSASLDIRDDVLEEVLVPPLTQAGDKLVEEVISIRQAMLHHLQEAKRSRKTLESLMDSYVSSSVESAG